MLTDLPNIGDLKETVSVKRKTKSEIVKRAKRVKRDVCKGKRKTFKKNI